MVNPFLSCLSLTKRLCVLIARIRCLAYTALRHVVVKEPWPSIIRSQHSLYAESCFNTISSYTMRRVVRSYRVRAAQMSLRGASLPIEFFVESPATLLVRPCQESYQNLIAEVSHSLGPPEIYEVRYVTRLSA